MLDYDIEHEDGVKRAMNLDAMFEEMRAAFKDGQEYYDLRAEDIFTWLLDDAEHEKELFNAVYQMATGNAESALNTLKSCVERSMFEMLEWDYTRIMNAKQEEYYNEW